MEKKLIDTCILIDYSRKKQTAIDFIEGDGKENFYINSIVSMELMQGAMNRLELQNLKKILNDFRKLFITQEILDLATDLLEYYKLSHHPKMPDMIIAATALTYNVEIKTYNLKDFQCIPNIKVSDDLTI